MAPRLPHRRWAGLGPAAVCRLLSPGLEDDDRFYRLNDFLSVTQLIRGVGGGLEPNRESKSATVTELDALSRPGGVNNGLSSKNHSHTCHLSRRALNKGAGRWRFVLEVLGFPKCLSLPLSWTVKSV